MKKLSDKISLLGVNITNATEKEILEYLFESLKKPKDPYYIVTPNPEIIVYATKHLRFQTILNNARLALPDGIGVIFAGLFLGNSFKERVAGVDFIEKVCQSVVASNATAAGKPIGVGFLGGRPGVAEKTSECLKKKYPGLNVVFTGEEWPGIPIAGPVARSSTGPVRSSFPVSARSSEASFNELRAAGSPPASATRVDSDSLNPKIDILFVAFGFPKQEEWMAEHRGKIPVKVMMGVGGAFDYISGSVSRAPFLIRLFGFEWLYRLIRQPWRIARQLALVTYCLLIIKERFRSIYQKG